MLNILSFLWNWSKFKEFCHFINFHPWNTKQKLIPEKNMNLISTFNEQFMLLSNNHSK